MGWLNLLTKDLREHAMAMFALGLGFILVVLIAIEQQRAGAFSLSGFEVVRFALISVIPLIAFIVGNRLIVREYVGGTRKFVEALPVRDFSPLLVKYFLGLIYITALCIFVVLIAAGAAGAAEDIDKQYLQLLLMKTCAIGLLFWSVVFFVSFTGRIRLVIYVIMGLTLMYVTNMPSFDETRFAPLALMDRQLFVFERELVPWADLIETVVIALLFVIAGFVLALVNEGSIAEQLGKPVSRRDMAAFALLGLGCITVYTTLQKKWETETYELSGEYVLRSEDPVVAISYLNDANKNQAEIIQDSLSEILAGFRADVGLASLPQVQIALNTDLEYTEVEPELLDGVLVTANFTDYDAFEYSLLNAITLHHLLLSLTNGRWDFETRHWLLDGFARWWAEGAEAAVDSVNNNELFALAIVVQRRLELDTNPLLIWQTITDTYGFEGADALSYSAIVYLEQIKGRDVLIQLAADYINEDISASSIESVQRLFAPDAQRFERITGIALQDFTDQWQTWLREKQAVPEIASLVAAVPFISGEMRSVLAENGVRRIEAQYFWLDEVAGDAAGTTDSTQSNDAAIDGTCVLRHQLASAYDQETMIYDRKRDRRGCVTDGVAHSVDSPYAPGDRFYGVLEFESDAFHRPIPLWSGRVHVQ